MQMTCSMDQWRHLSREDRIRTVDQLASRLGPGFEADLSSVEELCPVVVRKEFVIRFRVVFSHDSKFGFDATDEEIAARISSPLQANVDEMRPARVVRLGCFAISEEPIRASHSAALLSMPLRGPPSHPAFLSRTEAERCAERLSGELPTELHWEAAARGTSSGIFPFGNALPAEPELEKWMTFDLDDPNRGTNGFGLAGLFFGEWCKERYAMSHDPKAPVIADAFVIKGGGAYFWPWQEDEWVWCLTAMRMPSSDLLDGTAAARVVLNNLDPASA